MGCPRRRLPCRLAFRNTRSRHRWGTGCDAAPNIWHAAGCLEVMSSLPESADSSDALQAEASQWLARRDRGLTAVEQDEYLQWLRENPQHGRVVAQLDRTWQ